MRGGELTAPLPFVSLGRALRRGTGDGGRITSLLDDYRVQGSTLARAELVDSFADVIERRAFDGPVTLVVDDAHWVDDASMAVIDLIARQLPSTPVRLVLAARPHPRPSGLNAITRTLRRTGRLDHVSLPRLTRDESRTLTESVLGGPAGPGVQRLVERAGGNPLYCTELGLALRDHVVRDAHGLLDITDPDISLELDVIEHNLASLGDDCRQLLSDAALFGTTVDANELALLVDQPVSDLVEQLAAALQSGVLAEDDEGLLRFRHTLVRDAVVHATPIARVRQRHRELVDALRAAGMPPSTWAGHLLLADWRGHAEAWDLFAEAAAYMADHSLEGAADLLDHAMEMLDGEPPLRFVSLQLERHLDADRDDRVEDLIDWLQRNKRALRRASTEDLDRLALRALEAKWWFRARYGNLDIVRWFQRLQPAIGRGAEDVIQLDQHFAGLFLHQRPGHLDAIEAIIDRAAARGDDDLVTSASYTAAFAALLTGGIERGVEAFTESIERQLATGRRPAVMVSQLATLVLTVRARDEQVRPLLQRVTAVGEQLGPPASVALGLLHARFALGDGRWLEALQRVEEFVEWDRDEGFPHLAVATRATWPVLAYLGVARFDAARHVLDQARTPLERMHDHEVDLLLSTHHRDRALVALLADGDPGPDLDLAFDHRLAGLLDRVCDLELPLYVSTAALAGRFDLVTDYTESVLGSRYLRPEDAQLLEVLGRRNPDCAREVADRALAQFDLLTAHAVAAAARRDDEVAILQAARACASEAGATMWRDRALEALRALGVQTASEADDRPTTGLDALTPAEQRVLPLILDGLLYREIAEELHNSRRTIESHAASIMRKLGVSSRRELDDVVARADLADR